MTNDLLIRLIIIHIGLLYFDKIGHTLKRVR